MEVLVAVTIMGAVMPGNTDRRSEVGETATEKFRFVPTMSV